MTDTLNSVSRQILLRRRDALKFGGGMLLGLPLLPTTEGETAVRLHSLPFEEYARYDALGLAELIRKRQLKPEELLEAAIARANAVESKINSIVIRCDDDARRAVASGVPQGALAGVPFLVKDLGFSMAGVRSSGGSRVFRDAIAKSDDTVVERYRRAGLVLFGRTHSPEFGIPPVTESELHGITRNPWSLEHTAGGSSGGSAAAVAAGIVPMAAGNDGGGSIRIPASCCGLFGFKPTRARVPCGPGTFELFGGLAVQHAITRSVRDSAALLDATAGPEPGDPYWAPAPAGPFLAEVGKSPGKLRIGMTYQILPGAVLHPECRAAVDAAAKLCEALGHEVDDVTDQLRNCFDFDQLMEAVLTIAKVAIAAVQDDAAQLLGRELQDTDVEPVTWAFMAEGRGFSAVDLHRARTIVHRSSRKMAEFQRDYDVILSPTLAEPPIKHGVLSLANPKDYISRFIRFVAFTPLANWTGQPAMSVPLYWTSDGLPVGVHFMGRFGDEATLFRLASQLEQSCPWATRRPEVQS